MATTSKERLAPARRVLRILALAQRWMLAQDIRMAMLERHWPYNTNTINPMMLRLCDQGYIERASAGGRNYKYRITMRGMLSAAGVKEP